MRKAGDVLASYFDRNTLQKAQGYSELFGAWQSIAGDALAAHSSIREFDKSILLVEADHPGWIQILQTRQAELLERVRRRFPELSVSGISFRLQRDRPAVQEERTKALDMDTQEPLPGLEPMAGIQDSDLKSALQRLEQSIRNRYSGEKKPR